MTDGGDDLLTELRAWLEATWDPDLTVGRWWELLAEAGWAAPAWPAAWHGRGASRDEAVAVARTIAAAGALGAPNGLGLLLAGPTIIVHGTDDQKRRLLPDIVTGRQSWCQLFSEPGAGSDLAGLQCRAVLDGDMWQVDGQKVWTSGAQLADRGMLLVRTDPDVPKHAGISWLAMDMDQPGVDIRPLREMTGRSLFNEVFLTGVQVPDADLIGGANNGWAVANTTLANERSGLGAGGTGSVSSAYPGTKAGLLDKRAGDFVGLAGRSAAAVTLGGGGTQVLRDLAVARGRDQDPTIRQDLARLHTLTEIARYTSLRMKAAQAAGRPPGPEANTAKLAMSRIARLARDLGPQILGADGMLAEPDAPLGGMIAELTLWAPAVSIYGGSDQVQRNIIGERVLGLPSEPRPDKGVPFRQLLVGTQRQP